MESFFAKLKISIFRPKTMDYSPWFDIWESEKISEKKIPYKRHLKSSRMAQISVKATFHFGVKDHGL